MIMIACVTNMLAWITELSRFAIYFKQVHNFSPWAGMVQTAGDVIAAAALQLAPRLGGETDPDEMGRLRRTWHFSTSQPYDVTVNLMVWVVLHLLIAAPVLPVAMAAQLFMGSAFVSQLSVLLALNYILVFCLPVAMIRTAL